MTAKSSIDPAEFLHEHLAQASPDLLRELMQSFVNTLLSADADSVCGAAYGARAPERVNQRNGYRHRDLDTRVGTLDVAVPKLREGSYFPGWLLEPFDVTHNLIDPDGNLVAESRGNRVLTDHASSLLLCSS